MEKQKNIPVLRFPEFDGMWEKQNFGDKASNKSKKYNPEKDSENFRCIELEHLATGAGELLGYVNSIEAGSIKNRFEKGDVLFGKLRPYLRKYLLAPFQGVCSSEIWVISGNGVSNNFLYWLIQTNKFIGLANQSSGSKMPRADWDVLSSSVFSFPTLPEQQKIATFFTAIDQKISQLKKKHQLLEQYKKGVMQKIFSQQIRFKDDDGREFPKWEKKKMKDIFRITRGKVLATSRIKPVAENSFIHPVYSSQTSNGGLMGFFNEYIFEDCITWTTDGANAGDVNFRKGKFYCTNVCGVLESNEGYANLCVSEILNLVTRNHVSYVGNPKLMNNVMGEIQIILPVSLKEQTKIANFLSAIDNKIQHTQKQVEQAEQWKKGLMQKMFC